MWTVWPGELDTQASHPVNGEADEGEWLVGDDSWTADQRRIPLLESGAETQSRTAKGLQAWTEVTDDQQRAAFAMEMLKIHMILLKREIVLVVNGKFFGAQHILKIHVKDKWK